MKTFLFASTEELVSRIARAKQRIVFVAPGLTTVTAKALAARYSEPSGPNITVVLDADPEVCRLGYGEAEALDIVHRAATVAQSAIQHHAGVRIGVLLTDDSLMVYSPTPLLIEAGSNAPEKPNAIEIGSSPAEAVSIAAGAEGAATISDAEIGVTPLRDHDVDDLKLALEVAPPRDFDVARRERVFSSLLEYVELKVEGYRLASRVVNIPPALLGLAKDASEAAQWRSGYRLVAADDPLEVELALSSGLDREPGPNGKIRYGLKDIDRERRQIAERFLVQVPRFDVLILRSDRDEFDKRIQVFGERLEEYSKAVKAYLDDQIQKVKRELLERLGPTIIKDPPEEYLKRTMRKPTREALYELAQIDIERAFAQAHIDFNPTVEVKYKLLTYETIKNPDFRAALERILAKSTVDDMFEEFVSAPSESSRRRIEAASRDLLADE